MLTLPPLLRQRLHCQDGIAGLWRCRRPATTRPPWQFHVFLRSGTQRETSTAADVGKFLHRPLCQGFDPGLDSLIGGWQQELFRDVDTCLIGVMTEKYTHNWT